MIRHDLWCDCGNEEVDWIFIDNAADMPKCSNCGDPMQIHFGRVVGPARFNPNCGSMYGKYHAGFGMVVEDYAHKQRLLKQYNCIESSDAVKGSKQNHYPEGYDPDHANNPHYDEQTRNYQSDSTDWLSSTEEDAISKAQARWEESTRG